MAATLGIWIYILFIFISLGLLFQHISKYAVKRHITLGTPSILQYIFNGFCVCMGICSLIYFVGKIGIIAHVIIALPVLSTFFICKKDWRILFDRLKTKIFSFNPWQWVLIVLAFTSVMLATIEVPVNIDTGNYHAQSIRWMNEYKIVPGLGNLIGNLAYNQSNFLVEAFFSFSFLNLGTYRVLNGFLVLVFVFNIIASFDLKKLRFDVNQMVGSIIIIFFFLHYKDWISSPSPDIVIALTTYYVFSEAIKRLTNNVQPTLNHSLISIYFVAISAIAIKLSAIILPLIVLVLIIRTPNFFKDNKLIFFILLGSLIIIPWLIRSVLLSGYLIFPLAEIDIFNVDWKVPKEIVVSIKNAIHGFSTNGDVSSVKTMELTLWERILTWVDTNYWYRVVFLIIVVLSQVYYIKLLFSKKLDHQQTSLVLVGIFTFLGIVFWFFSAPDFRFGGALVYMSITITLIIVLPKKIIHHRFFSSSFILLVVFFLLRQLHVKEAISHPLKPTPYPKTRVITNSAIDFKYYVPEYGYQCWDNNFPCIPFGDLRHVKLRGESLENGFKFIYPSKD